MKAKIAIHNEFKQKWLEDIQNTVENPITRTYALLKHDHGIEPYLHKVRNKKYRHALTRLKTGSNDLRIEKARHEYVIPSVKNRLCKICRLPETEIYFMISCPLYDRDRKTLFDKILSYRYLISF